MTILTVSMPNQATLHQPVAQQPQRPLHRLPVKKRITGAHATSSSWAATYTPRHRNAAGQGSRCELRVARCAAASHSGPA